MFVITGIGLLMLVGWWGFNDRDSRWFHKWASDRAERPELSQLNQALKKENETLREQVVMLERSIQIDRKAYAEVQGHIKELQSQTLNQKEELEFYQAVLESKEAGQGVKVQGLRVEPTQEQGGYRFRLVLTHLTKEGIMAKGGISIVLEGDQGKQPKQIQLRDVIKSGTTDFSFNFKYVTRFSGIFGLPLDFQPRRVRVIVWQEGVSNKVTQAYDWADLIS